MVLATTALALGSMATLADSARGRASCALVAAALVEMLLAVTLGTVRQWRFAPAARARSSAALGTLALLVATVYAPVAHDGTGWSILVLVAVLAVVSVIAWPLARLTDSVSVRR